MSRPALAPLACLLSVACTGDPRSVLVDASVPPLDAPRIVDAAPSGVTFVAVTQQPVAGTCTLTAALLHCSLGTLGPGVERTIGLSARVTQTGTFVNSATAAGNSKDTNGANNTDDASTLVTAPATPPAAPPAAPKPAAKPKPKPHVDICRVLKVTPINTIALRRDLAEAAVRKGGYIL